MMNISQLIFFNRAKGSCFLKTVFASLIIIILSLNVQSVEAGEKKIYSIGIVPQYDSIKIRKIWFPIIAELTRLTGMKFKLIGSPTIPEFEKEFISGKFDFAYMNPYHFIVAQNKQGYIPLVRDIGRKLFGVLVVNKDSPINSVAKLEGETIAFPAPNALGASLMMRAELSDRFKINFKPQYVQTHSSVYLNVALNLLPAGGGVKSTLNRQSNAIRNKLRILHETQKVSPHPFSAHPRIPKIHRDQVMGAFLKLGNTKKGKELYKDVPIKQIGEASFDDYKTLLKLNLERFYSN
jgi:phosphonate transport system substrate-binding protein